MKSNLIDIDFINEWETKYDSHEIDENEYKSILTLVKFEINNSRTISKNTFVRIINWKSPRLKGIVKLSDYGSDYKPVIDRCISETNIENKLRILLPLYGINTPTATTILHFIYPDVFPIIDVRTTEALYHRNLLDNKSRSVENYWNFYEIIHRIKTETGSSLRKIDRALFSYHKILLSKKNKLNCKNESKFLSPFDETIKKQPTDNKMRVLDRYIYDCYKKSVKEFTEYLATKYIADGFQREVFLNKGVWLKVRLNYIAAEKITKKL
jgi:hypothetical protein